MSGNEDYFSPNKLLLQNGYPAGVVNFNINDVLNRTKQTEKSNYHSSQKETNLVLSCLGVQSKIITKQLKSHTL